MHTTKQDNHHKAHARECERCGRTLPKRAYKRQCATCIKTGKPLEPGQMVWRERMEKAGKL